MVHLGVINLTKLLISKFKINCIRYDLAYYFRYPSASIIESKR